MRSEPSERRYERNSQAKQVGGTEHGGPGNLARWHVDEESWHLSSLSVRHTRSHVSLRSFACHVSLVFLVPTLPPLVRHRVVSFGAAPPRHGPNGRRREWCGGVGRDGHSRSLSHRPVRSLPSSISLSLRSPLSRRAPRKESRPSHRLFSLRSEPSRRRGVGERSRSGRRPVRSPLRSLHLGPLAPLASVNRPPRYPTSFLIPIPPRLDRLRRPFGPDEDGMSGMRKGAVGEWCPPGLSSFTPGAVGTPLTVPTAHITLPHLISSDPLCSSAPLSPRHDGGSDEMGKR